MNFDDTPQEAQFRAEARKWIAANAPKQYEAELSKSSLGRIRLQKDDIVAAGKAWQKKKAEAGWACRREGVPGLTVCLFGARVGRRSVREQALKFDQTFGLTGVED